MSSGCCGQGRPRHRSPRAEPLPDNPKVGRGVRLLYLGDRTMALHGAASALVYHVGIGRRSFQVDPDDVAVLIRRKDVIQAP